MGSSKQSQTSNTVQTTAPWESTLQPLGDLIGRINGQFDSNPGALTGIESSALSGLAANAAAGNPYAPAIGNLATDLLNGGTDRTGIANDAYAGLQANLNPYITGSTDPYQNPAFQKVVQQLTSDAMDAVKSSYAGAGISAASYGDFGKSVGEGIARGIAPTWLQAYNDNEARKNSAIRDLYSGGNATAGLLSGLDQTALGNRQAGVGVSTQAQQAKDSPYLQQLAVEALRRGIPLQNLAQLESLIVPLAQLGGRKTSNTTSESTSTPSMGSQIMGGVLGGLGALGQVGAFGPTGWLLSSAGGSTGSPGGTGLLGFGGLY